MDQSRAKKIFDIVSVVVFTLAVSTVALVWGFFLGKMLQMY